MRFFGEVFWGAISCRESVAGRLPHCFFCEKCCAYKLRRVQKNLCCITSAGHDMHIRAALHSMGAMYLAHAA